MSICRSRPLASYFSGDCTDRVSVDLYSTDNAVDGRFLLGVEDGEIPSREIIL